MKIQLFGISLAFAASNFAAAEAERYMIQCPSGNTKALDDIKDKAKEVGKIKKEVPRMNLFAVEVDEDSSSRNLSKYAEEKKCKVETDQKRFINEVMPSSSIRGRKLAEDIPWGINKIFGDDIPDSSHYENGGKKICVIDTGYVDGHEDLPPNECATEDNIGCVDQDICSWHGTHVSGTIGALSNSVGVLGVHPYLSEIVSVKVFSGSLCYFVYSSDLIGAVADCLNAGAKITNMSLGGSSYSSIEDGAFNDFRNDDDMINVAASGNSGPGTTLYPAGYSSVFAVGATDENDVIAYFSSTNSEVDISAPGVDVESTIGPGSSYGSLSGTSMACPHVAGAVVALWNNFPQCSNEGIIAAIQEGAVDLGDTGDDNAYGAGRLDYWASYGILQNGCPTRSPTMSPTECAGDSFTLNLLTDNWGAETSFELTNQDTGEVVLSGSGYASNTFYSVDGCLYFDNGVCYEFEIFDSYGDGICCSWGSGYYELLVNGESIFYGGSFGSSETTEICGSGSDCVDSPLPLGGAYPCNSIAAYCSHPDFGGIVSSHCPETCNACDDYGCSDSNGMFYVNDIAYSCSELAGSPFVDCGCNTFDDLAATCKETCGYCLV